jgi:putative redox protein
MGIDVKAVVTLQGNTVLKGKAHTGHEVQIDYIPPFGGNDGIMPLELLLISLAGCSLHTVLLLLKKKGKTIDKFEVHAVGKRRDEHPTVFTNIELQYNLRGDNLIAPSVEEAIKLSEETYCPVWAMLKNNVAISWKYSVGA